VQLNKIKLTNDSSERLKQLKAKTGLTPNILCRIGFCLSLKDHTVPDPEKYPEEDREFNRYTLLGEWDLLYVVLLRQRLLTDQVAGYSEESYFRAHVNRGVYLLSRQVKCLADITCISKH